MKIAVVAVTNKGVALGLKVSSYLKQNGHQVDILSLSSTPSEIHGVQWQDRSLSEIIEELFTNYRALIMIMAMGIVIRVIAPHIQNKYIDPAVLVIDEGGTFVISALSGHMGGANDLARQVASAINSVPVITTATDVNNIPAIDVIARDYKLKPEPISGIKRINSALARGEKVSVYSEINIPLASSTSLILKDPDLFSSEDKGIKVLITNKKNVICGDWDLILYPVNLVVGVGCKRGVSKTLILQEIEKVLHQANRSMACLKALATFDLKTQETGLTEAADFLGIPLLGFTAEEIESCINLYQLNKSNSVMERMGVGGVCEPTAILACPKGKLLVGKTKGPGITVAVAAEESKWWESDQGQKI